MKPRYTVQFTPVGWQVNDLVEGREAWLFGTGADEYKRAKDYADLANIQTAYNKSLESVADIPGAAVSQPREDCGQPGSDPK